MNKEKRMKTIALVTLYILVFVPVINGNLSVFGVDLKYQVNISHLNLGIVFNLVFLAMMLFGLFTLHYRKNLEKISDWIIIVLVALLSLILIAAKDTSESFGLGYYLLWLTWLSIVLLKFAPGIMNTVYDGVAGVGATFDKLFKREEQIQEVVQDEQEDLEQEETLVEELVEELGEETEEKK